MKKFIYVICLCLVTVNTLAQQTEKNQKNDNLRKSKFERLFDIKEKIVLTESHTVVKREKDIPAVLARIGWVEGERNKLYAAAFEADVYKYTTVDFDRLDLLKNDIKRVIDKIEAAIEDDQINSVRYISPDGFLIDYYEWEYNNVKYQSVYFKYGESIFTDKTTVRLKGLLNSIDKVQTKLISLGAGKNSTSGKK